MTSYSLPTLPGFSASVSRSQPAVFASVSDPSSASIFAASSALGSASASSALLSHILKTVGNNVRIENRECHLHHFEQSVLSIEQVEEFNDKRDIFEIDEPLFQSWLILKHAAEEIIDDEVAEEIFDDEVTEEIIDDEDIEEIIDNEVSEEFIDDDVAEEIINDKFAEDIIDEAEIIDDEFVEEIIDKDIRNCVFEEEIRNPSNPNSDPWLDHLQDPG